MPCATIAAPIRRRRWTASALLALAAGCATAPPQAPPAGATAPPLVPPPAEPAFEAPAPVARARARWVPVGWDVVPGWGADRTAEVWPALVAGCARPAPGWAALCARALLEPPAGDADARRWFERWLVPYRVEDLFGAGDGLATGYFEPAIEASRVRQGAFQVPLYAPPADLDALRPGWTRREFETVPTAMVSLRGRELAWIEDPLDALLLQVQGSGRLHLAESDGSRRWVRLAYAAHNGQPYRSVGRWLVERGELELAQASWPAIRAWARRNPARLQELLWSNPRVVFFREEPLADPAIGPRGGAGVPLTPGRSIAVDPASIPYGTPVWIDTTEPLGATPLRRLVMAQDTGSAIEGAVRADFFWGWGPDAEAQAGRMKQPLRLFVLVPRVQLADRH